MDDYAKMTVKELRPLVRKKGWTGAEVLNAKKDELVRYLETGEKPGADNINNQHIQCEPDMEKRRPPKVYFPVTDILTAPDWAMLRPESRRIALDIAYMAWAEIDGMIADDDWRIAQRLDIPEEKWLEYRKILERSGWLIQDNGRLTNEIIKREFDTAQKHYMAAIVSGRKGGKASAANKQATLKPSSRPPTGRVE